MQSRPLMATKSLEAKPVSKSTASRDLSTVHLPLGLLGFEDLKKFSLVGRPQEAPFLWLEVQDDSGIAFLVVPPDRVVSDYRPDVPPTDTSFLGLRKPKEAIVFNIVTLSADGQATVNLKGPIVINARTRVGKQVVPNNAAQYSSQHPLSIAK